MPAAGRIGSTRLYDASIALTMREDRWRPLLRDRVLSSVPAAGAVADVGAGTGTLAISLAAARPDVAVRAIDGDEEILALARSKPGAGSVNWLRGLADDLPLGTAEIDAVVMSLVMHHLSHDAKRRALAEIARVLRPDGRLHIADWGRPATPLLRASFFVLQVIDGFEGTRDHAAGRVPELVTAAGFCDLRRYRRLRTTWGTLDLLEAHKAS